jgi:Zn-dependent protease
VTSRLDVYSFIGAGLGLLVGMIGHEFAHAWLAVRLGDQTPRFMGRLTLNPKVHVDPFGTLVMPAIFLVSLLFKAGIGFIFGYAKPVTIHPERMRKPRRDAVIVALAGPAFNLFVIVLAGIAFRAVSATSNLEIVLLWIARVNAFLFVINVLPIPPLDGSKILARFISPSAAARMEEYGQYLILFLIVLFIFFHGVVENIAEAVYEPILGIPRFITSG